MAGREDLLLWGDVETTGLNPHDGAALLEVGFRVTDLDLNEVDRYSQVIGIRPSLMKFLEEETEPFIWNMHTVNGLLQACSEESAEVDVVDTLCSEWIADGVGPGCTLSGASMKLDRDFLENYMPKTYGLIHYRTIDNSTLKELCRRYNPELFKHLPEKETDHRVDTCLDGSIEEFRFYSDNFIFDGRE